MAAMVHAPATAQRTAAELHADLVEDMVWIRADLTTVAEIVSYDRLEDRRPMLMTILNNGLFHIFDTITDMDPHLLQHMTTANSKITRAAGRQMVAMMGKQLASETYLLYLYLRDCRWGNPLPHGMHMHATAIEVRLGEYTDARREAYVWLRYNFTQQHIAVHVHAESDIPVENLVE